MTEPVQFDPFSDEYFNDPSEVYRRLRDEAPVYFSEKYGFYALSRFADVLAAHRDWETYSSAHGIDLSTLSKDSELIQSFKSIIMMDPPEHDRLRALVSRVFTPKAVTALEPMIREVICSFLEPLDDATEFDAVADFSANFPVEIIARLLGMPEADRQPFRKRLDISLHREHGQLDMSEENMAAVIETGAYFYELAVEKRKNPGDDMMSRLTQVTVDRGDGVETGLDDIEITGFAGLLGGAGRRDGDEARRQRGGALRAAPGPVAEDPRRPREDPARGRGDPAHPAALAVPGSVLATPTATSTASRSRPGSRCSSSPAPPPAIRARSTDRTTSTSNGCRASRSASGTACTAASARPSPAWRAASRSRSSPAVGAGSRSTTPGCAGSTCRTSRATRTCRSASAAEPRFELRSPARSPYDQRVTIGSENRVSALR